MKRGSGERNRSWQGSKWIRPEKRLAIYARDGFACVYCGHTADEGGSGLSLDHVRACELGGTNEASNLVTCCIACNAAKRDRTMRAWFRFLRDKGIETGALSAAMRRQTARKLVVALGKRLLAARKG